MQKSILCLLLLVFFVQCKDDELEAEQMPVVSCADNSDLNAMQERNFEMGFSTWIYAPTLAAREETYNYVFGNGDIYLEHMDAGIPWQAWINNTTLPQSFIDEVNFKVSKRPNDRKLVLSVSALNSGRDDLKETWEGEALPYDSLNDPIIENAYFNHVKYLVERLQPDYLIASIESNDLLVNSPGKWEAFKNLMANVRFRLKEEFPALPISESITLHNYFDVQTDDPAAFVSEVSQLIAEMDFAAISFYPFFKNLSSPSDFQMAFDFLHEQVNIPIAFVETNHLAEDLLIPPLDVDIPGDPCGQKAYLETLLVNAYDYNYAFVIWWAHRDYDALWETFPEEVRDLGRIWRDTGLLDEDGNARPAETTWQSILQR